MPRQRQSGSDRSPKRLRSRCNAGATKRRFMPYRSTLPESWSLPNPNGRARCCCWTCMAGAGSRSSSRRLSAAQVRLVMPGPWSLPISEENPPPTLSLALSQEEPPSRLPAVPGASVKFQQVEKPSGATNQFSWRIACRLAAIKSICKRFSCSQRMGLSVVFVSYTAEPERLRSVVSCSLGFDCGGCMGAGPIGCGFAIYWNWPLPSGAGPLAQRPSALSSPIDRFQN